MNAFSINLLFAVVWAALSGTFAISGVAVGFLVGYAVLWTMQPLTGNTRYCRRVLEVLRLAAYFLFELAISSLQVARDVITPRSLARPAVVAVPLSVETDLEIATFANLVSLTPGSLSIDVSEDKKTLVVHAMFVSDIQEFRQDLKRGMERRLLGASR